MSKLVEKSHEAPAKAGILSTPPPKPPIPAGVLALFPAPIRPFVEVTRLHKPAGLLGFYFPYLIGLFFTASLAAPPSVADLARLTVIFLADGLLVRSFGCAWNDAVDHDLDRQVARCKGRPVARGALSVPSAVALTLALAVSRHAMVAALLPVEANYHALFVTALAFLYPFAKRVTNYPQVILGTAVGWAIFLVDASVVRTSHGGQRVHHREDRRCGDASSAAVVAMFLAQTLWNVTYDTVYAFQDLEDDKRAGVMSMAVRFEHRARTLLGGLVVAEIAVLFSAGMLSGMTVVFYIGAFVASVGALWMLALLDVHEPKSCRWFFVYGQYIVSGAMLCGLIAEYFWKNYGILVL